MIHLGGTVMACIWWALYLTVAVLVGRRMVRVFMVMAERPNSLMNHTKYVGGEHVFESYDWTPISLLTIVTSLFWPATFIVALLWYLMVAPAWNTVQRARTDRQATKR